MEKLIAKLDELFKKYDVTEEEIAEVGELIAAVGGEELKTEGDDFEAPEMEEADGIDEEEGYEG